MSVSSADILKESIKVAMSGKQKPIAFYRQIPLTANELLLFKIMQTQWVEIRALKRQLNSLYSAVIAIAALLAIVSIKLGS